MINANRNTSAEVLQQLKEASYERFRIELFNAIEKLLEDFNMNWQDLADKFGPLHHCHYYAEEIKHLVGGERNVLTLEMLNDIAHVFSAEPYIIFRPRSPWVQT